MCACVTIVLDFDSVFSFSDDDDDILDDCYDSFGYESDIEE